MVSERGPAASPLNVLRRVLRSLVFGKSIALFEQRRKLFFLLRDAFGGKAVVGSAGKGRGLLDKLANVVAEHRDPLIDLYDVSKIGHQVCHPCVDNRCLSRALSIS